MAFALTVGSSADLIARNEKKRAVEESGSTSSAGDASGHQASLTIPRKQPGETDQGVGSTLLKAAAPEPPERRCASDSEVVAATGFNSAAIFSDFIRRGLALTIPEIERLGPRVVGALNSVLEKPDPTAGSANTPLFKVPSHNHEVLYASLLGIKDTDIDNMEAAVGQVIVQVINGRALGSSLTAGSSRMGDVFVDRARESREIRTSEKGASTAQVPRFKEDDSSQTTSVVSKKKREESDQKPEKKEKKEISSTAASTEFSIKSLRDLYYGDNDISEYLEYYFQQNERTSYFHPCKYVLTGSRDTFSPIQDIEDQRDYIVAVTDAIDTQGERHMVPLSTGGTASSTNLGYFLDRSAHPKDEKEEILEKLLNFIGQLGPDNSYANLLQKVEDARREDNRLEFIDEILSEASENIEEIHSKFRETLEIIQKKKRDVFDEIMDFFSDPRYSHVKILFPYNITESHWLAGEIRIHREEDGCEIEIYAHNPYGNGRMEESNFKILEEVVRKRLEGQLIKSIKAPESRYGRRQAQGDTVSCGAIVAEDILKRVIGAPLGDVIYPVGARELRSQHVRIVEQKNSAADFLKSNKNRVAFIAQHEHELGESNLFAKLERSQREMSMSASKKPVNLGVSSNTDFSFAEDSEDQITDNSRVVTEGVRDEDISKSKKEEDLEHLLEIYKLCESFINEPKNVRGVLKEIGRLAKIHHDIADKECIRNKYSTIDAFGNERQLRKNGINLVELKHLGDLRDDFTLEEGMLAAHIEEIKADFTEIKRKILFVFFQEKTNLSEDTDLSKMIEGICASNVQPHDLGGLLIFIPRLSNFHYDQLILKSIRSELELFDGIADFSKREDRYFWGRILVKIGEFLHPDELSDSYHLLSSFRPITGLRGKLIHSHRLLINMEQEHQGDFYKHAKNLFNSLKSIIQNLINDFNQKRFEEFTLSILDEEMKKDLEEHAREFLKVFNNPGASATTQSGPPKKKDEKSTESICLEQCIMRAADYLNNKNKKIKKKKRHETIENFNEEYEILLENTPLPTGYPAKLNEENQEQIMQLAEIIRTRSDEKKKKNSLEAREEHKQESHDGKITKFVNKITKEIDYIREIERGTVTVSEEQTPYIIQHAETIIGEYEREIRSEILKSKASTVMEKKTITMEEASSTAISQRNKGLGHEPLSLDHDSLLRGLRVDILPAYEDYKAIYTVGQHETNSIPKTAIILNRLGEALVRLCLYKEATEYFRQALQDIKDTSYLPDTIHPRTKTDQYKLDSMGITQPTTICIDMTQALFGVDIYELAITNNLVYAFLLTGDLEAAYNLGQQLLSKINPEKIEKYKKSLFLADLVRSITDENSGSVVVETLSQENPELMAIYNTVIRKVKETRAPFFLHYPDDNEVFDQFFSIFSLVAYAYYQQGDYQKAAEFYEQAWRLAGNPRSASSILSNLAHSYYQMGNADRAQEYLDLALRSTELLDQFSARVLLCGIQLDKNNPAVEQEVELLSRMLDEKKGGFKEVVGDRFWALQLNLYELKLRLGVVKKSNYEELSFYIKDALMIIQKLRKNDRFSKESLNFYFSASIALSHLISPNSEPVEERALEEAEGYFEEGRKQDIPALRLIQKNSATLLATAYSNYVTFSSKLPFNKCIEFLEKAKKLQEDYELDTNKTISNLGIEYHNHAESFFDKKNYRKAILYYEKAINILTPLLNRIDPEALKVLAMSHEGLGDSTRNIASLEKAKELYFQFLKSYPDYPDATLVKSYATQTLRKIQTLANEDSYTLCYNSEAETSGVNLKNTT